MIGLLFIGSKLYPTGADLFTIQETELYLPSSRRSRRRKRIKRRERLQQERRILGSEVC
jgi:hypothetical protein